MKFPYFLTSAEQKLFGRLEQSGGGEVCVSPMPGSSKTLLILSLTKKHRQIVVLFESIRQVQEAEVELALLGCATPVVAITEYSLSVLQERMTLISRAERVIVLATYRFTGAELPHVEQLQKNLLLISTETCPSYDDLVEYLNLYNYQKEDFVDAPGSYSKRGAIIDIWSFSEAEPARLEFDGDMLESLRLFDPESQRSVDSAQSFTLAPAMVEGDGSGMAFVSVFDYFSEAVVLYNEQDAMQFAPEFTETVSTGAAEKDERKHKDEWFDIPPEPMEVSTPVAFAGEPLRLIESLRERHTAFHWIRETPFGKGGGSRIELGLTDAPPIHSNYQVLFKTIGEQAAAGITTYIAVENQLQFERYSALLEDPQNDLTEHLDAGRLRLILMPLKAGFVSRDDNAAVFTDYQLFNKPYRTKLARRLRKPARKSKLIEAIRWGDFVVHEEYGIGKYLGLASIRIGDIDQESMKLQYAEGGIVYVNLNYLHLVKKYSAKEGIQPALSTLGTTDWSNKKRKAKKKIREAAKELIELYAKRKMSKGYAFRTDTVWQQELEASFMYEDTVDQARVTEEVKADMQASSPMDRLVCGDVGFGKTEIAVRAAFKAVQDGKQAAILVPTTILAEQHYNTFKDRLSQFPLSIEALSRFQSKTEQADIIERLKAGRIDIVIGTHRLLSKDVGFRDLGLLIIDEEHRFGVAAKEKLRKIKLNVDILTMTATPIPRTLNLSLLGARDLSLLATPPSNRQPIYTKVEPSANARLRSWILTEMQRGGQVYVVHDRISTIERFAEYIQKQVPEAKVAIVHGQMQPAKLEDVFHAFLHRKYDILLATKIIESGLDIPNVNTIIINRAERFGLAELHQLRGRVGRADRQAYAYLLVPTLHALQKGTVRRLQAIEEHSELGAGFQLAMRDLEIRGAGNLLGTEQTGFINEIGFDLYIKLINESVDELKQEEFKELFKDLAASAKKTETVIDSYFEIGIPQAYIPDQMDRLGFYTALSSVAGIAELREIEEELRDRFGALPMLVKRLLMSAELKYYAGYALFERVIIQQNKIIIVLPQGDDEEYYQIKFPLLADALMTKYRGKINIVQKQKSLQLQMNHSFNVPESAIEYLTGFAKETAERFGLPAADVVTELPEP